MGGQGAKGPDDPQGKRRGVNGDFLVGIITESQFRDFAFGN
jgi:hypothetical protein